MLAATRDALSEPAKDPTSHITLGHCIGLSIILFVAGLLLPLAFSFTSTILQVAYCDLCKCPDPRAELQPTRLKIRYTLVLSFVVGSAGTFAIAFTQLQDQNGATRGLKSSVIAFVGTIGLEILASLGTCIVIRGRHVLVEGKFCRNKRPTVSTESVGDEDFPRVDSASTAA